MNSCSFKNINDCIHTVYLINLLEPCSRCNGFSSQSRHILEQDGDPNPNPLHMLRVQSQGSVHVTPSPSSPPSRVYRACLQRTSLFSLLTGALLEAIAALGARSALPYSFPQGSNSHVVLKGGYIHPCVWPR